MVQTNRNIQDTESALVEHSAVALTDAFRRRDLSPVELTEACIARIRAYNPFVNAVTATCFGRARDEARESERRYREGTPCGPLDGLPIGIKDLQDTEGLLTTYGSPPYRGYVPTADQPLVARLRRAGGIVLGKTNVPEMGAGGNTRNPVWGATGNPFDPNLNAGGSSGGSAVALALDMMPLCTGSDTGGSLRLPAALCGIVGFRPSADLVGHPTRPLGWSPISVLGPMARSVDDLVLMLRSCVGLDANDPLSAEHGATEFTVGATAELGDLRVGWSEDFGGCAVDPAIRAVFRRRVEAVAPHVAVCEPVDLSLGDMDRCFDVIRAESFVAAFKASYDASPEALGVHVRANYELGARMLLADRAWAHLEQTRILRAYNALAADYDVILAPTTPVSPFSWQTPYLKAVDGRDFDTYYRWLALTYRGTLTGAPALALPCGRDDAGMPFGMQVLGKPRGDAALLRAARALETLFQSEAEMQRPRPDPVALRPSVVPLTSVVTAPPDLAAGGTDSARVAV